MTHAPGRWQCQECMEITHEDNFLKAPNPFDPADTLSGCPACKAIDQWRDVCDEAGCNELASCGFPDDVVRYRRTCYEHSAFKRGKA